MKNSKKLLFVSLLAAVIALCFVFAACAQHEHSAQTEWKTDANQHWHACSGCDEKLNLGDHEWGSVVDGVKECTVCHKQVSVTPEPHRHSPATEWTTDANQHWHACGGCDEKLNVGDHEWGSVVDGIKECSVCHKEVSVTPEPHKHDPATAWTSDDNQHWHACSGCDEKLSAAGHTWGAVVNGEKACTYCGHKVAVPNPDPEPTPDPDPDPEALTVTFTVDSTVSVVIYETQDVSGEGTVSTTALTRDSSGNLVNDGSGQINFKLNVQQGYVLEAMLIETADATVDALGYKNLKYAGELSDNAYRITKITHDLVVTVTTVKAEEVDAYSVHIVTDSHCSAVLAFDGGSDGYARNDATGALSKDGGQVNFNVQTDNGYIVDEIVIANADGTEKPYYKNFKTPATEVDFLAGQHRITKITGDLVVTITTKQAPFVATVVFADITGTEIAAAGTVTVFATQDYSAQGTQLHSGGTANILNGDTGEVDTTGNGQLNLRIDLAEGYRLVSVEVEGPYKNKKDVSTDESANTYRITKVGGDIVITIVVAVAE